MMFSTQKKQRKTGMLIGSMRLAVVAVSLLFAQVVSAESVTLNEVRFSALPGDRFEIRMAFDGQPPEPTKNEIVKPARVWFDFENVENSLEVKKFPLSFW